MKILRLILPACASAAMLVLVFPRVATSYTLNGSSLDLGQRDVRVFNNFTSPVANLNQTPDPDFPGAVGAELAIWKAVAEWGSGLRNGTGDGDPTQPGDLGSGGANFDSTWQGRAFSPGTVDSNVISEISSCDSLIYSYAELPSSDGWSIRFCAGWDFSDNPQGNFGVDIQGMATSLYGFVLGLGPSTDTSATMYPNGNFDGHRRSLEQDDILGLRNIYGLRHPAKPEITGVSEAGGVVTITGTNFPVDGNEVWFTRKGANATGEPVKVGGVGSTGTVITVALPDLAGPGDVLVRTLLLQLSNAFALDVEGCTAPQTYCTGKTNSLGNVPSVGFAGQPSLAQDDLVLTCDNGGLAGVNGIHFWSDTGPNNAPFFNGVLCLAPPVTRGAVHTYDAGGDVSVPVPILQADVGRTRWFQFWFRDLNHPDGTGTGLSDALRVVFCD